MSKSIDDLIFEIGGPRPAVIDDMLADRSTPLGELVRELEARQKKQTARGRRESAEFDRIMEQLQRQAAKPAKDVPAPSSYSRVTVRLTPEQRQQLDDERQRHGYRTLGKMAEQLLAERLAEKAKDEGGAA